MPTYIKTGFWDKKAKAPKEWLDLNLLIQNNVPQPTYKVYTALLTQSGDSDEQVINTGTLTIGVTYKINSDSYGMDFTNVGAPNNTLGTYFVATGTTPNSWGVDEGDPDILIYNLGTPVVTVLENTLGSVTCEYLSVGAYKINLPISTPGDKVWVSITNNRNGDEGYIQYEWNAFYNYINILTTYIQYGSPANMYAQDGILNLTSIEIRVYN